MSKFLCSLLILAYVESGLCVDPEKGLSCNELSSFPGVGAVQSCKGTTCNSDKCNQFSSKRTCKLLGSFLFSLILFLTQKIAHAPQCRVKTPAGQGQE